MKIMSGLTGRLTWLAATVGALFALSIATQAAQAAERVRPEPPCNGFIGLCEKPFDQVTLAGTHNSMSAEDLGWAIPNQLISIPRQLDAGIRGFLIDTHYGRADANGVVTKVSRSEGSANGDKMYLCHEYCQLGSSELIPELAKVRDYLAANPREVVLFINQDGVTPADYSKAVTQSGLIDYIYTGPTNSWPTLSQMIASNQRVVMLAEGGTGDVPWYHDGYAGTLQETPYDFRPPGPEGTTRGGIDNLTLPAKLDESCRPNRGGQNGSLFLMNHWVNGTLDNSNKVAPDPAVAAILNTKEALVNRANACQQRRGLKPTLIAVDDFGEGDLLGAVNEINGVVAKPFLETSAPKNAFVKKAGKAATYRVSVSNFGDAAGKVSVCAKVPKVLAKPAACKSVELAIGATATVPVKIWTKKTRGKGVRKRDVRFTLSTEGDSVATKAALKVKSLPKKKPKKKKKHQKKRR